MLTLTLAGRDSEVSTLELSGKGQLKPRGAHYLARILSEAANPSVLTALDIRWGSFLWFYLKAFTGGVTSFCFEN